MGLTPQAQYTVVAHTVSWRFRWLTWRLRVKVFWHRVWASRGIPLSEWRTRYRGVKILEDRAGHAIERHALFGK